MHFLRLRTALWRYNCVYPTRKIFI